MKTTSELLAASYAPIAFIPANERPAAGSVTSASSLDVSSLGTARKSEGQTPSPWITEGLDVVDLGRLLIWVLNDSPWELKN